MCQPLVRRVQSLQIARLLKRIHEDKNVVNSYADNHERRDNSEKTERLVFQNHAIGKQRQDPAHDDSRTPPGSEEGGKPRENQHGNDDDCERDGGKFDVVEFGLVDFIVEYLCSAIQHFYITARV